MNREHGLESLFDGAGGAVVQDLPTVQGEFTFGWLPAGGGLENLSVVSVAGPAVLVSLLAAWPCRRRSLN